MRSASWAGDGGRGSRRASASGVLGAGVLSELLGGISLRRQQSNPSSSSALGITVFVARGRRRQWTALDRRAGARGGRKPTPHRSPPPPPHGFAVALEQPSSSPLLRPPAGTKPRIRVSRDSSRSACSTALGLGSWRGCVGWRGGALRGRLLGRFSGGFRSLEMSSAGARGGWSGRVV